MARQRDSYITEWADTVDAMFNEGIIDPSAEEIAERNYDGKALPPGGIAGIRKCLPRLKAILETDYNRALSLVNDTYFSEYRHLLLVDDELAKQCVARGSGNGAAGFRLRTGDDDLIYQAALAAGYASGVGKIQKNHTRLLDATENGNCPKPRAASILSQITERTQPDNRELAQRIMTFAPAQIASDVGTRE